MSTYMSDLCDDITLRVCLSSFVSNKPPLSPCSQVKSGEKARLCRYLYPLASTYSKPLPRNIALHQPLISSYVVCNRPWLYTLGMGCPLSTPDYGSTITDSEDSIRLVQIGYRSGGS
jgi:hypothetical protein